MYSSLHLGRVNEAVNVQLTVTLHLGRVHEAVNVQLTTPGENA